MNIIVSSCLKLGSGFIMYICIYSRKTKAVTIPTHHKKRFYLEIPQNVETMNRLNTDFGNLNDLSLILKNDRLLMCNTIFTSF